MSITFIDLNEAIRRSGLSRGHLQRVCKNQWQAEHKAEQRKVGKGKKRWFVREDADVAFALVKPASQIGTDLRAFPQAKREKALLRLDLLKQWEQHLAAAFKLGFDKVPATEHFVQRLLLESNVRISARSLYNWETAYRAEGLVGLIDGRGSTAKKEKAEDPFLNEVKRLYLRPSRPKLTACHELACYKATENGWQVRGYKMCQRFIAALPAALVYKLRGGEEEYVNNAEPFLEGDYTTLASNEKWNTDHHRFDVIVKVSERRDPRSGELKPVFDRPWLTAIQDMRSRKILGWKVYAHDPNSDVIRTVIRQTVLDYGVCQKLLIDNGKDFDASEFTGETKKQRRRRIRLNLDARLGRLFAALGITVEHAQPYHGQSKSIERWFGFVETRTFVWPTYCGNSTDNKPENLQANLDRGQAPTLEEFAAWFDEWVRAYNAGHEHSGQGMDGKTPDQVYAECFVRAKVTASRELLDVLCLKEVPAKVGQNGVTWQGMRYGQHEPALQKLLGQDVILRVDEREISQVQVYTAAGIFLCIAPSNRQVPKNATSQELRSAMGEKRRDRRLLGEYIDRRPRMADDLPDRMLRAAAAKAEAADRPEPESPSLKPVRSELEDQLPALRRAVEGSRTKVAAGGEAMHLDDLDRALRASQTQNVETDPMAQLSEALRRNR